MSIDKVAKMADRIMDVATPIATAVSASIEDDSIRVRGLIYEEVNTGTTSTTKALSPKFF